MFKLILRDGAPENTGIHEGIETAATLKRGQAVSISAGKAVVATDGDVYGIVAEEPIDGIVTVLKVTPDMIFKARATADPTSLKQGGAVTIDGVSAVVVDTLDAKKVGDYIEVRFE